MEGSNGKDEAGKVNTAETRFSCENNNVDHNISREKKHQFFNQFRKFNF